jgi:hypothetical protein
MKVQPLLIVVTFLNLGILIFTVFQLRPAVAVSGVAPVLRAHALEIVDKAGKVRASIQIFPASTQENGKEYPETVLLRLITERGRPSVKISAAEPLAGLVFAGPTGTSDTYVQLLADGKATSLRLKNENGREYVLKP